MIGKILASGQLGKLASFVSPAFFDVMPAKALWARARGLLAGTRDHEAFRQAAAERAEWLARALPEIELTPSRVPPPRDRGANVMTGAGTPSPEWRATRVAELFFHQLFHGQVILLDLRGSAFSVAADHLQWRPANWLARLSPEFSVPLRALYQGFYAGDDDLFRHGLAALSLTSCEDLFREHFGGDRARVTFRTVDFIDTFHQVFERCKQTGTSLHPDFLPLGIYLAALYDHLDDLAVAVDVASAFMRATRSAAADSEALHA